LIVYTAPFEQYYTAPRKLFPFDFGLSVDENPRDNDSLRIPWFLGQQTRPIIIVVSTPRSQGVFDGINTYM
jgi:hypothetical protein